jgi:hypothetical protein
MMAKRIATIIGGLLALALLVAALWGWRHDGQVARGLGARNVAVVGWSVRCAAVAVGAVAEAVLGLVVIGNLWRRDGFSSALGLLAALVFMLSAVSAVALGLAGR